jgi:uncharacterized protein
VVEKPPLGLSPDGWKLRLASVKLLLDNLPPSLQPQRETLAKCLEAFNTVAPVRAVYLFGSHARGEARPDSDVDLCIVAEGAEEQLKMAQRFRHVTWDIWPLPPMTLLPIAPERLAEKKATMEVFYATVLNEGVLLATQN